MRFTSVPTAPNFLDFMQFLEIFDKIICWRPTRGSAPPATGNPGFAPDKKRGVNVMALVNRF